MITPISRIILFVRDPSLVADFYEKHFGLIRLEGGGPGWIELSSGPDGCAIALHRSQRDRGPTSGMKLSFGVTDVDAFVAEREAQGLRFGRIQRLPGFAYADARDPAGNAIQVSSRGMGEKGVEGRDVGEADRDQ